MQELLAYNRQIPAVFNIFGGPQGYRAALGISKKPLNEDLARVADEAFQRGRREVVSKTEAYRMGEENAFKDFMATQGQYIAMPSGEERPFIVETLEKVHEIPEVREAVLEEKRHQYSTEYEQSPDYEKHSINARAEAMKEVRGNAKKEARALRSTPKGKSKRSKSNTSFKDLAEERYNIKMQKNKETYDRARKEVMGMQAASMQNISEFYAKQHYAFLAPKINIYNRSLDVNKRVGAVVDYRKDKTPYTDPLFRPINAPRPAKVINVETLNETAQTPIGNLLELPKQETSEFVESTGTSNPLLEQQQKELARLTEQIESGEQELGNIDPNSIEYIKKFAKVEKEKLDKHTLNKHLQVDDSLPDSQHMHEIIDKEHKEYADEMYKDYEDNLEAYYEDEAESKIKEIYANNNSLIHQREDMIKKAKETLEAYRNQYDEEKSDDAKIKITERMRIWNNKLEEAEKLKKLYEKEGEKIENLLKHKGASTYLQHKKTVDAIIRMRDEDADKIKEEFKKNIYIEQEPVPKPKRGRGRPKKEDKK